ncbi:MAG: efflux RND transporter permease subunit [Acidaminococcaceae bacterium]|nr:efflux RND transporter permease subunit [Acidaminococcaceae bacterium]
MNWAEWSIKHRQVVYFFMFLCLLMGIYSYEELGRSEDPSFTIKEMVVSASWPGATAKQMELHVTDKLEKIIQTVPDLDYTTSYSRAGVSVITVHLKDSCKSTVVKERWKDLRNIVNDNKSDLPSDIYGPYFNDRFDDVYGNIYAVTSDNFSYEAMRKVASKIKDKCVGIPDVKKVELIGVQQEQINLRMSNDKLSKLGLSVSDLSSLIQAETAITPAGMVDSNTSNVYLRLNGLPNSVENIKSIPIKANGRVFRLGDIAEITRGYPDPADPKMYFNGKPAIGIAISMTEGGNNIKLGKNLDNLANEVRQELPLGFEFNQVANQPQVVQNSINEFVKSLLEAVVIVLVVSLMSLGRQCGYVISICIPLVLLGSFISMFIMGIDLHKVSLGALIISLGMLVDDSIVVVELMEVKMAEGWDRVKAASFAFKTCAQPLLVGTLVTCAGFLPIALSNSLASEFASSLFPVISITLLLSWFISATVAPVLGYNWIKPKKLTTSTDQFNTPFYKGFRKVLDWSLCHRKAVILTSIVCLLSSLLLLKVIKNEFFPGATRPEILVELNLPEGSSVKATDAAATKLTNLLKDDEGIVNIGTYVGKSAPRFVLVIDPVQPRDNYAQLVVVAKDLKNRLRLEPKIRELVAANLPNVTSYSQSIPLGPPTPYPVMLRVSAPTDALAKEYAAKVRDVMNKNENITMTIYDWMDRAKALKVEIDNDKLRQMGLTRKTVASALQAEISGYTVAHYLEGDQSLPMVFRLDRKDFNNVADVANIAIPTSGGAVPLSQVANISYTAEENMIYRRNLLPTITVEGGIKDGATGNDVTKQVYDQLAKVRKNLPPGVTINIGGPLENSNDTLSYIMKPVPIMLITMLVLLMLQLQDIRKLIILFCTAPFGIIGVLLGLLIFNAPMGFLAELGVLALVGIIIRNSIVLMDQIVQHLDSGMDPYQAVLESAIVRFRPIMLAAITTVLGLIPMFPSKFWQSMAVALSCGLTGATIITLIVMPVMYVTLFNIHKKE